MKTKLIGMLLLAGSSLFAGPRVFFGIGFGAPVVPAPVVTYAPPPPPPISAYAVPAPGPAYTWIAGYYYPAGARYVWRPGYWARPPYARTIWVAPRYVHGRYYHGHWRR